MASPAAEDEPPHSTSINSTNAVVSTRHSSSGPTLLPAPVAQLVLFNLTPHPISSYVQCNENLFPVQFLSKKSWKSERSSNLSQKLFWQRAASQLKVDFLLPEQFWSVPVISGWGRKKGSLLRPFRKAKVSFWVKSMCPYLCREVQAPAINKKIR